MFRARLTLWSVPIAIGITRLGSLVARTHATGCPTQGSPSRPDRTIASSRERTATFNRTDGAGSGVWPTGRRRARIEAKSSFPRPKPGHLLSASHYTPVGNRGWGGRAPARPALPPHQPTGG